MTGHELLDILYLESKQREKVLALNYWSETDKTSTLINLKNQDVIADKLKFKILRQRVMKEVVCFVVADDTEQRLSCTERSSSMLRQNLTALFEKGSSKANITYQN